MDLQCWLDSCWALSQIPSLCYTAVEIFAWLSYCHSVYYIVGLLTAYGSGLGSGYGDGYGGGAMKGQAYAAKAPGPYGGMKLHCLGPLLSVVLLLC